jgi:hypothetical protein
MPACPWQGLPPANLSFCEADVCGWITQPANTWTNVGFLIAGIVIIREARRAPAGMAAWLGPIAIATGLASTAAHATSTFVGQALDQAVMFLESSLFVAIGFARWRRSPRHVTALYAALVIVSTVALLAVPTAGIALFAGHIVVFVVLEVRLAFRDRATDHRYLIAAVATFAVSYGLWWLDKQGIVCDPSNHVLGLHGVWHFLGALSFPMWFRYFAQFAPASSIAIGA